MVRSAPGQRAAQALAAGLLGLAGCAADRPAPAGPSTLLVQTVQVGGSPWGVVADGNGDGVWVSDFATGRLLQLGPAGEQLQELPVTVGDPRNSGLALRDGRLWVANLGGTVAAIPVATPDRAQYAAVEGEAADVAVDGARVWAAGHGPEGVLVQLDATDLQRLRRISLPEAPFQVELAGSALWVAGLEGRVFRLDAESGAVRSSTPVGPAPRGLSVTPEAVWVTVRDAGELVRLDPAGREPLARLRVGGQPWPVAAEGGEVWVADLQGGLLRVDAATLRITHRTRVPGGARGIALTRSAVWVTGADGSVSYVRRP